MTPEHTIKPENWLQYDAQEPALSASVGDLIDYIVAESLKRIEKKLAEDT